MDWWSVLLIGGLGGAIGSGLWGAFGMIAKLLAKRRAQRLSDGISAEAEAEAKQIGEPKDIIETNNFALFRGMIA